MPFSKRRSFLPITVSDNASGTNIILPRQLLFIHNISILGEVSIDISGN